MPPSGIQHSMATLPVVAPLTNVHAVLSTPELVTTICYELLDLLLQPVFIPMVPGQLRHLEPLRSLRALALSCRFLSHFALEALWSNLPDIAILLRTLPSNCWEGELDPEDFWPEDSELVMKPTPELDNLKVEDCTRFTMYCRFIQRLLTDDFPSRVVDVSFFRHLKRIFGPQLPLPRLRRLRWGDCPQHPLNPFAAHFFVPSLQSIEFLIGEPRERVPRSGYDVILPLLLQNCPGIRKLTFTECGAEYEDPLAQLSDIYLRWRYLTHLEVPVVSTETFIRLATGDYSEHGLARLAIGNMGTIDWDTFERTVQPQTGFTTLRHFTLSEISFDGALKLFKASRTSLTYLRLNIRGALSGDNWESLFRAVRDGVEPDKLEFLALSEIPSPWRMEDEDVEYPDTISSEHLLALLPLKNLQVLYLHTTHGYEIGDVSICQLAQGLPTLETLRLCTTRKSLSWTPALTLNGVAQIALRIPKLECLTIPFDAYSPGPLPLPVAVETALECTPRKSQLCYLDVRHSPIDSATTVAPIVKEIFPNIEVIICEAMEGHYSEKWRKVRALLGIGDEASLVDWESDDDEE
ncbi:hypothetical protein BDN72DRAFT_963221 [Pluteus cervinus]|uniref:Uncharacterized protein n=1 Tax=Pluteus cervinus TaxID=181527 RepID=A0ACD3AFI8_9AGAR|nr:hypothetical protein BDN72DRAFT_963221 [Pluteus cervinus]